jgi:thiol-disulfide isomerase/thioredoxin
LHIHNIKLLINIYKGYFRAIAFIAKNMRSALLLIVLFLLFMVQKVSAVSPLKHRDAYNAFKKVSDKLNGIKAVQYQYSSKFSYPSEDYLSRYSSTCYLEFDSNNSITGFKYQNKNKESMAFFNGTEAFECDLKDRTIAIDKKPKLGDFQSKSYLFNSLVTLRNALPLIINDNEIKKEAYDTLYKTMPAYVLKFALNKRTIDGLGKSFSATTIDLTFIYKVIVDAKTDLAIAVLQTTTTNKDLNETFFEHINLHPKSPTEQSWYYSSYFDTFKPDSKEQPKLIAVGQPAPAWSLANYVTDKNVALADYRGSVVLLEFWIKNCGHCIEAVDVLNALNDKYKGNRFKIVGVDTQDEKAMVGVFKQKHPTNYDLLYGDDGVDKKYGLFYFPTVVLIDKSGTVIYSGELNTTKLTELIDKNI